MGSQKSALPTCAVKAPSSLNEAMDYGSAFTRALRVDLPCTSIIYISGTASVDENGATAHVGDFAAQCKRTFDNITGLLAAEGLTWKHIVRTSCYLRDIERDYAEFNRIRNEFYAQQELDPLPASTGIEARICRTDLLVEIEAIAMVRNDGAECSEDCA